MKTRQRTALAALAITTGLVLTMAGCGGGDDGKAESKSSATPKQTSGQGDEKPSTAPSSEQTLAEVKSNGITLTVTSAARDQGGFLTLSGKVTNGGGKFWIAADWRGDERELSKNGSSLAGASVVDKAGKKKYLILRDTQGRCLCTKFEGGGVDAGQSADWYAQFPAPPEGTTKVDFQVGDMPPAPVEISEGE
ncbi:MULTISPECIES: hypothetical protein [unclassified Streptomyces]|uniref:hypothetical protein n=1 Tax=unclassified Streptomyces TaxID=2593676 RepID=UPI00225A9F34|nr:hypothetical protein [Streptomyces sp. NBC_00401]MCX5087194.1 hypothetical protein [Streptomyces sp. NBC_00401]